MTPCKQITTPFHSLYISNHTDTHLYQNTNEQKCMSSLLCYKIKLKCFENGLIVKLVGQSLNILYSISLAFLYTNHKYYAHLFQNETLYCNLKQNVSTS